MDGAHAGDEPVAHATNVPSVLENSTRTTDTKDTSAAEVETRVDAPTMPDPNTDAAPREPEAHSGAPEAEQPAPVNEEDRSEPESEAGKEAMSQSVPGTESEAASAEAPTEGATKGPTEKTRAATESEPQSASSTPAQGEPMHDEQDAPQEPAQDASSAAPTTDKEPASKPDDAPKEDAPKEDAPKEDAANGDLSKEDPPKDDTSKSDAPKSSALKPDTKPDAPKSKPTEPTRPKSRRVALLTQPLGTPVERTEASPAPTDSEADKGSASDTDRSGESDTENPTETEEDGAEAADKSAEAMDEDSSDSGEDDTGSASRKRPRSPSPEEDEPESVYSGPPPRPTIRLEVEVHPGGSSKSDYIIPVPKLSVSRMQSKHPKWAAWYSATYLEGESSHASYQPVGLSEQELEDLGGLAKLLQKYPSQNTSGNPRKRRADEYDVGSYDTKDPFVDDSELGMDEPTHIVKTRSDGFYVALGPVELARAKMTRPSSRSESAFRSSIGSLGAREGWAGYARQTNKLLAKRAASKKGHGPRTDKGESETAPTPPADGTPSEPEPSPAPPRPAPEPKPAAEPSPPASGRDKAEKKKNKYPTHPVHPQLQTMFDHLKTLVQRASFAVKTKFPPELKPPLIDTAKLAVELDEYNENFFNYLPSIFPYNRFTMMFFPKHMEYYRELQEEHLDILYKLIQDDFPRQEAEYAASAEHTEGEKDAAADKVPESPPDDDQPDEKENDGEGDVDISTDDHAKRFRWNDEMRDELFTIVTVENAMSEIRNEKLKLENSPDTYSEINARKALYKRIADFVPEGWMNSTNVSREYGTLKKRRDRDALMELDEM